MSLISPARVPFSSVRSCSCLVFLFRKDSFSSRRRRRASTCSTTVQNSLEEVCTWCEAAYNKRALYNINYYSCSYSLKEMQHFSSYLCIWCNFLMLLVFTGCAVTLHSISPLCFLGTAMSHNAVSFKFQSKVLIWHKVINLNLGKAYYLLSVAESMKTIPKYCIVTLTHCAHCDTDVYTQLWRFFLPPFAEWQHVALWQWETLWAPRYAVCSPSSGCSESLVLSAGPTAPTLSLTTPASAGQSTDIRHGATSTASHINSIVSYHGVCVCVTQKKSEKAFFSSMNRELLRTAFALFSSIFSPPLIKNAFGTDSPACIIYYTSSLFMIDEKSSKNRITKLWLVCAWSANMRSQSDSRLQRGRDSDTHINTRLHAHTLTQLQISVRCAGVLMQLLICSSQKYKLSCHDWARADWSENESRWTRPDCADSPFLCTHIQYCWKEMYVIVFWWHHDDKVIGKVQ